MGKVCTGCARINHNILFSWYIRIAQHPCHDTMKEIKPLRGWITFSASSRDTAPPQVSLNLGPMLFLLYLVTCSLAQYLWNMCIILDFCVCYYVWVLWALVEEQFFPFPWLLSCDYRLGPMMWIIFLSRKGSFFLSGERKVPSVVVYGERSIYSLLWKFRELCLMLGNQCPLLPATKSEAAFLNCTQIRQKRGHALWLLLASLMK